MKLGHFNFPLFFFPADYFSLCRRSQCTQSSYRSVHVQ